MWLVSNITLELVIKSDRFVFVLFILKNEHWYNNLNKKFKLIVNKIELEWILFYLKKLNYYYFKYLDNFLT